jgi:hypothetical protein
MLIVAVCHASACSTSGRSSAARSVPAARETLARDRQPTRPEQITDGDIELAVTRRVRQASTLPAPLVQASVENGIVTLLGRVNRDDERLQAAELAKRTRGVRAVVNRLVVEPGWTPRSDDETGCLMLFWSASQCSDGEHAARRRERVRHCVNFGGVRRVGGHETIHRRPNSVRGDIGSGKRFDTIGQRLESTLLVPIRWVSRAT